MTETGAQRFEDAWREACANHENMADAMGRLLDEQGAALARVEALADDWDRLSKGETATTRAIRAALAPEAEGPTS